MLSWLAVALGGALGAVSRYAVTKWAWARFGHEIAAGTFIVNATGCFLLAYLIASPTMNETLSPEAKLALGAGFLGAFTTFSTFGIETLRFVEQGQMTAAVANVGLNLIVGLAATWIGLQLGRA